MEKIRKVIKSRFFISAFIILLQFIQVFVVFILLYKYSIVITILSYVFYIGVFTYIINKYESPEFKLPWIIIIMLFFVFGAFAFILINGNEENKKIAKKYNKNKEELSFYLEKCCVLEEMKDEDNDAYLQANYIKKTTGLPCFTNTKVDYLKEGEEFYLKLIKSLKKAKEYIFMEYFIIEDGIMWNTIHTILKEKVKNGVRVYVIYDDFGCIKTLDEKYYEKLNEEGINCIICNKFKPIMSRIHNNRDHRKITVIDGLVGFTGGINLADEYINEKVKYGHWKDTAIKIEGEAVKGLVALFLETWNTQSKNNLNMINFLNNKYKKNDKGFVVPYGDGPVEFYKDSVGKNVYLNMLNSAKKYIYITTPYLICDYEILNALCICAKKGVDVRIILPHIPDKKTVFFMTQSNYEILVQNGVKIYEYTPGFIHAKQFVCDDKFATCGTINLDYRSLVHHFECGVWMYKVDCIEIMKKDFLDTLNISNPITIDNAKLKGWKKLIAEFMKVFSPLL